MAVTSDPRFLLTRWSSGADPFTRAQLDNDLATLDQYAARAESGLLSARPAAGIRDRFYTVRGDTAALNGTVYYDDGTSWAVIKAASSVPVGTPLPFAGSVLPDGYLWCNGQSVAKGSYPELFAALGTVYGSTTLNFSVPDLRGRTPLGLDNLGGAADAGVLSLANTLGLLAGAQTVALAAANLPPHAHTIDHDHGGFTSGGQDTDHSHSGSTGGQSAQHTHVIYHDSNYKDNVAQAPAAWTDQGSVGNTVGVTTTAASSDHGHAFGTGGASAGHGHFIDVPNYAGSSGNGPGTTTAIDKLPPVILLNWIIRALP